MVKNIILVILFCSSVSIAQGKQSSQVIYTTILNTAGTDINKALTMADSLYQYSDEPMPKVQGAMLLAVLNLNIGKKKESLDYAFIAEKIAFDNSLYEWQAKVYGFISSHYRSIGLMKQSRSYLDKGLHAIENVKDKHLVNQYKGLVFQEFALFEIENKQYLKAIAYLNKAEPCFHYIKNKEIRMYQLATNYGQLGRVYINLDQTDKAIANFKKALGFLSQIQNEGTVLKGFMYEGIGRAYLEDDDFKKAIKPLLKALHIVSASKDMSLGEDVYCDLAIYYMEVGDKLKYKHFNTLYLTTRDNSLKANKASSESIVNRLEERRQQLALQDNLLFGALGALVVGLIILVLISRANRKKKYKKFRKILKNVAKPPKYLKKKDTIEATIANQTIENNEKELMSKEVELVILSKLEVFEQGSDFTNKNINLSSLSVLLETNTKYLSYVINKHKKKDFNNYINELRIVYIIQKLKSSPEYLNYKISYLAEECGFSSHSKFTDKFKMVTDMSPSSFIRFLSREE